MPSNTRFVGPITNLPPSDSISIDSSTFAGLAGEPNVSYKATKGATFAAICYTYAMCYEVIRTKIKGKGSPYWITERRVQKLIPVFGSQPAGDRSQAAIPFRQACSYHRTPTNFAAW